MIHTHREVQCVGLYVFTAFKYANKGKKLKHAHRLYKDSLSAGHMRAVTLSHSLNAVKRDFYESTHLFIP